MKPPRVPPGLTAAARWAALAGVLLLLVQAALALAREPCVGVADNLDYWRVARPAGIDVPPQRRQGYFVVCSYPEVAADLGSFFSSPALVAWMARPLGWGLQVPAGQFDLRQLGLLYWAASAAVLAGALALGLPPLLALLFAWVLADPGFLLFFNSLYADPALLLGLLGVACFLPLAGSRRWPPALLLPCAALAGFSKMQYSPFPAVLLGACTAALVLRRERPGGPRLVLLGLLALVAVAGPYHFFLGAAPRFPDANAYNAVYGGIARVASSPEAALAALGIPAEYRSRPAKDYFAAGVGPDDPVLPALRKLSRVRLAGLYLRDPAAAGRTATRIAEELWKTGTNPRGNYTHPESGRQRRVYETPLQFSLWRSWCLRWLPPQTAWIFLAAMLGALVYRGARGARGLWTSEDTLWLFLVLWVCSQAAVAVLGEGFVNLHQHLLGARFGFDLLLVLALARGLTALLGKPAGVGAEALERRDHQVDQEDEAPGLSRQEPQGGERQESRRGEAEQAGEAFHRGECGLLRNVRHARMLSSALP